MVRQSKKGQYSVEMVLLIFVILGLQIFFFAHFSQERSILNELNVQQIVDAQLDEIAYCAFSVEILGQGSVCQYYLSEYLGGRNYSIDLHPNTSIHSLELIDRIQFSSHVGEVNQTYTNISQIGNVSLSDGEVIFS